MEVSKKINWSTCAIVIWWTLSPHDPRKSFGESLHPTLLIQPRHLHLKNCVELSPTQEKLEGRDRYITSGI